jgi:hypothetical protein
MDLRKHYFMTCAALFFLGLIVARPGATFQPMKEQRECKLVKGKMDCESKNHEYRLTYPNIHYEYH